MPARKCWQPFSNEWNDCENSFYIEHKTEKI
nr:MAG TPA: hypothetical protein [Caudoviricetes sp.]DAO70410.1 MAG TPA: hypothetical protein [Bacteriophage sp.]